MFIGFFRPGTQLTRLRWVNQTSAKHPLNVLTRALSCTNIARFSKLQVGDRIVLQWTQVQKGKSQVKLKLTRPLREDGQTEIGDRGHIIKHKDIIGKESYTKIEILSKDRLRRLPVTAKQPTLDEFISLTPRRVAPIYASYAATIVSMLEIHPSAPLLEKNYQSSHEPGLQILEAGTGHGGLTLHLARAIAGANASPSSDDSIRPLVPKKTIYKAGDEYDGDIEIEFSEEMEAWRTQRNAVLHTIDIDSLNRLHADQLIRSFRSALYWPHINFYTGDVKDWVSERLLYAGNGDNESPRSFLDVAVLDMPGVEDYIELVAKAIKPGRLLLVFQPQITQIAVCVQRIAAKKLDLEMETVLELGDGISTGRHWDVELATLKSSERQNPVETTRKRGEQRGSQKHTPADPTGEEAQNFQAPRETDEEQTLCGRIPPMICRPLVGQMTRGGGFVGLWRKSDS